MGTITTIASFFHTTYEWIDAHLREHTDGIGFSAMLRNPSAVNGQTYYPLWRASARLGGGDRPELD